MLLNLQKVQNTPNVVLVVVLVVDWARPVEVRTSELNLLPVDEIDTLALLQAGLINQHARTVKVILSGEVTRAIKLRGLLVTQGAKAAIEAAGGSITE